VEINVLVFAGESEPRDMNRVTSQQLIRGDPMVGQLAPTPQATECDPSASTAGGIRSWIVPAGVGLLFLATYLTTLGSMARTWLRDDANMEHGLLVPVAVGYMVWLKRGTLRLVPVAPSAWGIVLVGWGLIQYTAGVLLQAEWTQATAFLVSLVGALLALYGFRMVRELAYPLGTLLLMIPPPSFIWRDLTLQLQLVASRLGELALEMLGYSVLRQGTVLEMAGLKMEVATACSGIKSLMALIFLTVVYEYFFVPQKAVRVFLLAAVVPIAILCNGLRIVATGVAGQFNPALAHGLMHEAFGYVSLATGAALCIAGHRLFERLRHGGVYHA